MTWLRLLLLLLLASSSSFAASFLSSAWRRRKKTEPETLRLQAMLPGYDCGLCGEAVCSSYARSVDRNGANPALCSPGGSRLESRLRSHLMERPGESRGLALRAVVRCGGRESLADQSFVYDGLSDCRSAARRYGGPRRCKDGCLGFGSCVSACLVGAIQISSGLAFINPSLCTGCGECAKSCPNDLICLIPRDRLWYVACSSRREPSLREVDCRAACTGCGECTIRSGRSEFLLEGSLARENTESTGGRWAELAAVCPAGAIVLAGAEKRHGSPFRKNGR